jgi:hypothetical protein
MDVRRFCCSYPEGQSTVLAFDKTCNLTDLHVTVGVFKNLSVFRNGTTNHPLFIGPMFIHGNSDFETFATFFGDLSVKLADCSSSPVLGSDDEKAMRKAMKHVFPTSRQIVCIRHIKLNVIDYLTSTIGANSDSRRPIVDVLFGTHGLSLAEDEIAFDQRASDSKDIIKKHAPLFIPYFESRVLPIMKENMLVSVEKRGTVGLQWMNNDCESANHILKLAVDWRPKSLTELINILHDVVRGHYKDLERSLIGQGQYTLCPEYERFKMHASSYCAKTQEQRRKHFHRFLKCVKSPVAATVTSTNGQLSVRQSKQGGKKPNQVKRKRCAKTKTLPKHLGFG